MSSVTLLSACNDDDDNNVTSIPETQATTIVDVAVENGNFTTLVAALQATGLDATLDDENRQFTVFAPTDAAFALLPEGTVENLLADTETLSDILAYHVVSGRVNAAAAVGSAGSQVPTVNGDSIGLSLDGDSLLVNTSTVTLTDIITDNGIIHVIDAVLLPPADKGEPTANIVETAVAAGSFTTLVAALQATGLDATLADESSNFTVFAPTDAAFELVGEETIATLLDNPDALSSILLQHVVAAEVNSVAAYTLNGQSATTASDAMIPVSINSESDTLQFGGANIVTKDIYTTNGIIHVIDAVIVADVEIPDPVGNIAEVASAAGSFNTLIAALQATGLDEVIADEDQTFTVFAPTDAAFALLPEGTVAALLNDTETLSNILLYHVVSGEVNANDAITIANSENNKAEMVNGQLAALSLAGSELFINTSKVSTANIGASNGVIHVVDQVILPPALKGTPTQSIVDIAISNPDFSILVAALQAADLVDALADEDANYTVFAPTNAAFQKIPADVLNALVADEEALTNVLLQHVVNTEIDSVSAFAANGKAVNTLANDDVAIELVNYAATSNTSKDEVAYNATSQLLVGGNGTNNAGFTLYTFDGDLGLSTSSCYESCARAWPPVLVTYDAADNIPGLGKVTRADGIEQVTFMGRPLYFFAGDEVAGDVVGDGLPGWKKVILPQVALQVQGANVTTTDIYTTNGVIHVIDTVITETLE
jgi:uncharacterized surface protein with fasciclin (FAS1) repeats